MTVLWLWLRESTVVMFGDYAQTLPCEEAYLQVGRTSDVELRFSAIEPKKKRAALQMKARRLIATGP